MREDECLRGGNQPHDAGECGLFARGGYANAKASAAGHGPRDDVGAGLLRDGFRFSRDHGFVDVGRAFDDHAVRGNASSRPHEDHVTLVQLLDWDGLNLGAVHALGGVGEQCRQRIERAASLEDGPHLQPVAEHHDGNQRCEFPPDVDFEQAEGRGERGRKGYDDCQADQRHHAGLAGGEFGPCAAQEDAASVKEDDGAQYAGKEMRSGEDGRRVAEPMLDFGRPD